MGSHGMNIAMTGRMVASLYSRALMLPLLWLVVWSGPHPSVAQTIDQLPTGDLLAGPHPVLIPTKTDQAKSRKERLEEMKKQVGRLAELANSLQNKVARSNENTLSVEVLSQVKQIEKLARHIKREAQGH